jgi:hypothetical protein
MLLEIVGTEIFATYKARVILKTTSCVGAIYTLFEKDITKAVSTCEELFEEDVPFVAEHPLFCNASTSGVCTLTAL